LSVPAGAAVADALHAVGREHTTQPEALTSVHVVDGHGSLRGVVSLVRLLQAGSGELLAGALLILHTLRPATPQPPVERARRDTWRMPAPAAFRPVAWCLSLKLGMILLRGYLIPSALLLVVKAVRLGRG
jgi:hypothetical protein